MSGLTEQLGRNSANPSGMMAMQAGISPEDMERMRLMQEQREAEYKVQLKADKQQQMRATALEAALRCAQPGAHADAVIETARQFMAWLAAEET